jgi:mono/diheme cytochrome c family protein
VISQGRGAMPAAQVSNEQAAAIADYVAAHIKGK